MKTVATALMSMLALSSTVVAQATTTSVTPTTTVSGVTAETLAFLFNVSIPLQPENSTFLCESQCIKLQYRLCDVRDAGCFCDQARMDAVNCCLEECAPGAQFPHVQEYLNAIVDQCTQVAKFALWMSGAGCSGCPSCSASASPTKAGRGCPVGEATETPCPAAKNATCTPMLPEAPTSGAGSIAAGVWQYIGQFVAVALLLTRRL